MTTKKLCLTAMGTALFVVLALCIQVPVFENYYICLGYVAMMVWCYHFGTFSGTVVGTLGVVLYCLVTNGLRGMPGWVMGDLAIGLIVGGTCSLTRSMERRWLRHLIIGTAAVLSAAIGMLAVKSFTEMILYAQPMAVRMAKNLYAFIADAVTLAASLPVCVLLEKPMKKILKGMRV